MVEPIARIRPLQPADDRLAKFIIAKASMEGLAAANVKTLRHPLTISIWVGLSCVFVQYMNWWPSQSHYGWLGYLAPVPAFMALAAPILALSDWLNRPYFEEQTHILLRKPDMADLCAYYANPKRPASGFWLLEYGNTFVGLVAVDASSDDEATISHFYVDEPYRAAHAQNDLLSYAVKHAFTSSPHVSVRDYVCQALDAVAFLPIEKEKARVGVFKWKVGMRRLNRSVWGKREQ
ncbi:hypothetical protein BDZ89DRAFT_1058865 [Hymenopellis radicata]|nr:hypothetical protein BDZ89DRAFT_1058865 [Hymenopellis radicata]